MRQNQKFALIVIVVAVLSGGAWFLNSVLGEPEAASAPISSIPLELTGEPTTVPPTAVPAVSETAVPDEPESEDEPANTPEPTLEPSPEPTAAPSTGLVIFEIRPSGSEVRFTLDELLRGEPTTVVGRTDQVAGQIAVDLADLSTAQVGVIQVNARTLATDNEFRNRAISNTILDTNAFEFITFAPTAVTGLPGSASVGETVSFQLTGNLTIRDITREVIFEATVTVVSAERLEGTAVTTIQRGDYNLAIPEVESVADVSEAVLLEIDFVATP